MSFQYGRRLIKACDIPKLTKVLNVASDDIYAAGKGEQKNG